jgi:threonine/homoserine/homoserine lactone efflux protein
MLPSLDPGSVVALFVAMTILAALPSASVLVVTAHSVAYGFGHGASAAAGVVAGDLIYILVAIFGLHLLVEATHDATLAIGCLGGLYLAWLAWRLWRSAPPAVEAPDAGGAVATSRPESFVSGLLITLGDQKAILFYLGFLPAFLDLADLRHTDVAIVALVAMVAVGGVKLLYAALAGRARAILGSKVGRGLNRLAALILAALAAFLLGGTFLSSSAFVVPLF